MKVLKPLLTADNITVSFLKERQTRIFGKERRIVLHDVSLHLHEGECLGIIGESGSGKSTLGRVLTGLLRPDSGRVLVDGLDIHARGGRVRRKADSSGGLPDVHARDGRTRQEAEGCDGHITGTGMCTALPTGIHARGGPPDICARGGHTLAAKRHLFAVVFQDYTSSANPRFRVSGIIGESLRVLEQSGEHINRAARVAELLDQVGLPAPFASRYPHELSGGQLQRVCIARALALRPRIILLDEAISSLDASTQIQIMDLLQELRARHGLSYIFITHDLTSITYLCDRVLFFKSGRVVERVENMRLLGRIQDPYSRLLLDSSIMCIGIEEGNITTSCCACKTS